MKKETFIPVKTVVLKNNCPECFNNEALKLTFKQKTTESRFTKSVTSEIQSEIYCDNCNTQIYPERWTDDIERVFDYQTKAFEPKPTSRIYKKLFWGFIITAIVVIATITVITLMNL